MFGMVLMNDWTARDLQRWEYVPLGPFTAKNWGTTISPWVVTFDALEPFRRAAGNDPFVEEPLQYLRDKNPAFYDIDLFAAVKTEKATKPHVVTKTNYLNLVCVSVCVCKLSFLTSFYSFLHTVLEHETTDRSSHCQRLQYESRRSVGQWHHQWKGTTVGL
jgi:hypothetical protein